MENLCLSVRDFLLGRIGGIVGIGDTETEKDSRKVITEYLLSSLKDYKENEYVAPELGKPFPNRNHDREGGDTAVKK